MFGGGWTNGLGIPPSSRRTRRSTVPRLSEIYGIVIWMYYGDHPPPHFHATYGDHVAQVAIDTLSVLAGGLPARALRVVREWGALHRDELSANWGRAVARQPLGKIERLP